MMPEGVFRLLMPADGSVSHGPGAVTLGKRSWLVTDVPQLLSPDHTLEYTCISYSWGPGRVAHPLAPGQLMSDRALPSAEVVIHALQPKAIWLDALCVPMTEPERTACLRSMGAIYASASQVAAVLSETSSTVLEQIHEAGRIDTRALLALEQDDWVSRAWTYQEMVNGQNVRFLNQASAAVSVAGDQLLNAVGAAIADYKKARAVDSFELRRSHPRLDSLEDLIADWLAAPYAERLAYQVMSSMDRRVAEQADDRFNAMIGAISAEPMQSWADPGVHPADYFMRFCAAKGDYSFIYSSAPRSDEAGRGWRPAAGPLPAILPWHTFGVGQSAREYPEYLQLDGMCYLKSGPMTPAARRFIEVWLHGEGARCAPDVDLIAPTLARLRLAGFSGTGDCIELESGLFFPQSALTSGQPGAVAVATGIRWIHGAPGLLLSDGGASIQQVRDLGVFVGVVPETGSPVNVA
jgi:hypothetical protein